MMIEYEFETTAAGMLEEFAQTYGSLEKLRRTVRSGRAKFGERADLEEWEHYKSKPPGMKIHVRQAAIFHDPREFFKLITAERIRALDAIRQGSYESVHELAKDLGRDPKNVHADVKVLEKLGLVEVERRNARRSVPRARVERIHITM